MFQSARDMCSLVSILRAGCDEIREQAHTSVVLCPSLARMKQRTRRAGTATNWDFAKKELARASGINSIHAAVSTLLTFSDRALSESTNNRRRPRSSCPDSCIDCLTDPWRIAYYQTSIARAVAKRARIVSSLHRAMIE
jgi:hypothetical protein